MHSGNTDVFIKTMPTKLHSSAALWQQPPQSMSFKYSGQAGGIKHTLDPQLKLISRCQCQASEGFIVGLPGAQVRRRDDGKGVGIGLKLAD